MKKLYIYNCNNLNEFLNEVETDHPEYWDGTSTEIPYVKCKIRGKSYAFNEETLAWDILIDDWRGTTFYKKTNPTIIKKGSLSPKPNGFIEVAPPQRSELYKWDDLNLRWLNTAKEEEFNPQNIIKLYEDAIQQYIDKVAQERGYDNGYTCESYYKDINPRYASDAQRFKEWRSKIWTEANRILNSYMNGGSLLDSPSGPSLTSSLIPLLLPSVEDIINSFPTIKWEEI